MRAVCIAFAAALASCQPSGGGPAVAPPASSLPATARSVASAQPPEPEPIPPDPLAELRASLSADRTESVLLLGVHLEPLESFAWIYDDPEPPFDTAAGYRTLVIRRTADGASVVAELPYVVLPRGTGYTFSGEASVKRVGSPAAKPMSMPEWHWATAIWQAKDRAEIERTIRDTEARLATQQRWGTMTSEAIVAATPAARCLHRAQAAVTLGAAYFNGSSSYVLDAHGVPLSSRLVDHADDNALETFLRGFASEHEIDLGDPPDLDAKVDIPWKRFAPRVDVGACLVRSGGAVKLTGTLTVPSNSHREWAFQLPVADVPPGLAPDVEGVVPAAAVGAALPTLRGYTASPSRDLLVVLHEDRGELVGYDRDGVSLAARDLGKHARIISAAWAEGETARRWISDLR